MRSEGMQVVALGARRLTTTPEDAAEEIAADPMTLLGDLTFVGLVGIVDPIRPDARAVITTASRAGIDLRVVTGRDPVTAASTAAELGLAGEAIGGPDLASLSDETVRSRLTGLRIVGWASAIDRLRLTRALQAGGTSVAVLSNGVVDAPAMRAAGVGAASRPGSAVTDQAASVVVGDGGLAALLRAIAIGRETRDRVAAYGRLAAIQLVGLVSLFVTAALLDVNGGLPLVPVQVLFLGLVVTVFPVVAIASDVADPGVMEHPPDDPDGGPADRPTILRRLVAGLALGLAALAVYPVSAAIGWGEPAFDRASVPMTLAFVTLGFGTILVGLAARRPVDWAFKSPLPRFLGILLVPLVLLFLSTELGVLKAFLVTVDLRQEQWGVALLLGSAAFWVMEADKLLQRRVRIRFH